MLIIEFVFGIVGNLENKICSIKPCIYLSLDTVVIHLGKINICLALSVLLNSKN